MSTTNINVFISLNRVYGTNRRLSKHVFSWEISKFAFLCEIYKYAFYARYISMPFYARYISMPCEIYELVFLWWSPTLPFSLDINKLTSIVYLQSLPVVNKNHLPTIFFASNA